MTVKRNGSRVVLKNGKVSCTCCGQEGCCMYPAQALADGLYTVDDLPDEVFGTEDSSTPGLLTKLDPPTVFPSGAIQYYNNPESGGIYLLPNVGLWTDEAGVNRPCLISLGIEDQFADTYTITPTFDFPPIVVERVSLCRWEAEWIDEGFDPPRLQIAYLEIQFADVSDFFGWYVGNYGGEAGYAEPVTGELGRLNTPIGDYGDVKDPPPRDIIFTVS